MNTVTILTFITTVAILDVLYHGTEAKQFSSCQLANELLKYNLPRPFLIYWVCLIENSGGDTSEVNELPDSSANFGLFQINSKDWCRDGYRGGNCNINCADLLDDDISDDIKCAAKMFYTIGSYKILASVDTYLCEDIPHLIDDC